jgi:hypothetical protein
MHGGAQQGLAVIEGMNTTDSVGFVMGQGDGGCAERQSLSGVVGGHEWRG